jgi:hypothetical protein
MERMKPYDVPHKGLRNALSQLQFLAGRTDYTHAHEIVELYRLGKDVFSILTIHAADENEVTLAALEGRCPGCSQHDLHDHAQIHEVQAKLENLLEDMYIKLNTVQDLTQYGEEFYLGFSEFHGHYLEHTAEEERVTQPLLWKYFSDEELADHRSKIMARNPPETLLIWFRFIIPALTFKERVGLLGGFQRMAPEPLFNEGLEVIRRELAATEFEKLNEALSAGISG